MHCNHAPRTHAQPSRDQGDHPIRDTTRPDKATNSRQTPLAVCCTLSHYVVATTLSFIHGTCISLAGRTSPVGA